MANPTRFTRVIPDSSRGLHIGPIHVPPGTPIGCAAYTLHHGASIFADPSAFRLERWLEDDDRLDMEKSMMPFKG